MQTSAFVGFLIASTLEYASYFLFALVLFRFSVREHGLKFLLSSVILSFVSNTLQIESLQDISPLVNVFLMVFLLTIILKIRLLHALIMGGIAYLALVLVQWLLYTMLLNRGVFESFAPYTWSGFVLQGLTAFTLAAIAGVIRLRKGGFSYIQSDSRFFKDTFRGNRWFLFFLLLGLVNVMLANIVYLTNKIKVPTYLYTFSILFVIIMVILIYFSIRKDDSGV